MKSFYFGGFTSGSNACLKRESNQIYVFIFVENLWAINSRLRSWRDVGEGDIKIFLANLIAMGLVRKGSMLNYWDHEETVKTSSFETYMQVSDSSLDLPCNHPYHYPLFKVCPFMDMLQKNFKRCYKLRRGPKL